MKRFLLCVLCLLIFLAVPSCRKNKEIDRDSYTFSNLTWGMTKEDLMDALSLGEEQFVKSDVGEDIAVELEWPGAVFGGVRQDYVVLNLSNLSVFNEQEDGVYRLMGASIGYTQLQEEEIGRIKNAMLDIYGPSATKRFTSGFSGTVTSWEYEKYNRFGLAPLITEDIPEDSESLYWFNKMSFYDALSTSAEKAYRDFRIKKANQVFNTLQSSSQDDTDFTEELDLDAYFLEYEKNTPTVSIVFNGGIGLYHNRNASLVAGWAPADTWLTVELDGSQAYIAKLFNDRNS